MKTLKILQDWPLRHNGKELNRGDIAEFDDKSADWLLARAAPKCKSRNKRTNHRPNRRKSKNRRKGQSDRATG